MSVIKYKNVKAVWLEPRIENRVRSERRGSEITIL